MKICKLNAITAITLTIEDLWCLLSYDKDLYHGADHDINALAEAWSIVI